MSTTSSGLYDPTKTFDDNFENGPFSPFTDEPKYQDQGEPTHSFLGKKLYSSFGIAAGPLPTSNHIKHAFNRGFDVLCYKTQRNIKFPCNEFPNVLYLDIDGDLTLDKAAKPQLGQRETDRPYEELTITNSFGNPSRGSDFWVEDLKKAVAHQGKGQLLIMSVVGTIQEGASAEDYYDDFAYTAELAAGTGVEAIEVNLSCPNVATEGVLCYTPEAVIAICKKTKERIGDIPLIAKLGYYKPEQQDLLEQIIRDSAQYVAAYAAINTLSAPVVDENGEQALPGPNRLNSGVCGAAIKWAGLDMTKRLKEIREKLDLNYEIIGIGGVMHAEDFQEYRNAGADVVQCATGAMWNANLAAEIKTNLK